MKPVAIILAALALGATLWWGWMKLFPPEEVLIQRLIDRTAQAASFGPGQGELAKLSGASALASLFTTNAVLKIDAVGGDFSSIRGRAQIQQLALMARQQAGSLSVSFSDATITLEQPESARANLVVTARAEATRDPYYGELKLSLVKTDGLWLIHALESVQTVRRVE